MPETFWPFMLEMLAGLRGKRNGRITPSADTAVARTDVLLLDDWRLAALDGPTRADLMEVIDDWARTHSTIVTSQLPVEHWHARIGDATVADSVGLAARVPMPRS